MTARPRRPAHREVLQRPQAGQRRRPGARAISAEPGGREPVEVAPTSRARRQARRDEVERDAGDGEPEDASGRAARAAARPRRARSRARRRRAPRSRARAGRRPGSSARSLRTRRVTADHPVRVTSRHPGAGRPPSRTPSTESADPVADQLRADHEAQHGHDRRVVGAHPRLQLVEDAAARARRAGSRSPTGSAGAERRPRAMNTASAIASSPVSSPAWAIAAAAPTVSSRFFGLTRRERRRDGERAGGRERVDRPHPRGQVGLRRPRAAAPRHCLDGHEHRAAGRARS